MTLNLAEQYADDRNLSARQRLWRYQEPYLDIVGWVVRLAGPGVSRPTARTDPGETPVR